VSAVIDWKLCVKKRSVWSVPHKFCVRVGSFVLGYVPTFASGFEISNQLIKCKQRRSVCWFEKSDETLYPGAKFLTKVQISYPGGKLFT
jgi:hypothetical protein